ncbi:MAG: hypothetical protein ACLS9I_00515 [Adlercreutzia equolifaciens]|uniref:hypothetical protein n=1 Tax=Adlercreutzia equolifaciens TaxID=446660 RepID=UPI003994D531
MITKARAEDIWRRFSCYLEEGGSINSFAQDAHEATGMNQGSAFIYLTILDNLINGKHNTGNMKMSDLEFYMDQIKNQLDDRSYSNAVSSLRSSIPYWDKEEFGQFAANDERFQNAEAREGRRSEFKRHEVIRQWDNPMHKTYRRRSIGRARNTWGDELQCPLRILWRRLYEMGSSQSAHLQEDPDRLHQ